MNMRRWH